MELQDASDGLSSAILDECKEFKRPPLAVSKAFAAAAVLLGAKKTQLTWDQIRRKYLLSRGGRKEFLQGLKSLKDLVTSGKMPAARVKRAKAIFSQEVKVSKATGSASEDVGGFVRSFIAYYDAKTKSRSSSKEIPETTTPASALGWVLVDGPEAREGAAAASGAGADSPAGVAVAPDGITVASL